MGLTIKTGIQIWYRNIMIFDYKKYVPKVIITEHSARGFERDERIRDFLLSTEEYDLCCQTEVTYIFKHKSIEYK